jgi:hypothetical protein
MAGLTEWVNSKSALTPGIVGGTTMLVVNTVCCSFGLDRPWDAWIAMAVSALFGYLVVSMDKALDKASVKLVMFVLNSLVIFATAMGTNAVGMKASEEHACAQPSQQATLATAWHIPRLTLVCEAYAQPPRSDTVASVDTSSRAATCPPAKADSTKAGGKKKTKRRFFSAW